MPHVRATKLRLEQSFLSDLASAPSGTGRCVSLKPRCQFLASIRAYDVFLGNVSHCVRSEQFLNNLLLLALLGPFGLLALTPAPPKD